MLKNASVFMYVNAYYDYDFNTKDIIIVGSLATFLVIYR